MLTEIFGFTHIPAHDYGLLNRMTPCRIIGSFMVSFVDTRVPVDAINVHKGWSDGYFVFDICLKSGPALKIDWLRLVLDTGSRPPVP